MNHKKIRRMRKFNLATKVRQAQPYQKIARAHGTIRPVQILIHQFNQGETIKVSKSQFL